MGVRVVSALVVAAGPVVTAVLAGCGATPGPDAAGSSPAAAPSSPSSTPSSSAGASGSATPEADGGAVASSSTPTSGATPTTPRPAPAAPGDGRQRLSTISIPTIGVRDLRVVPYRGTTDDDPGSAIQDGGVAATPGGPDGGTGPGGVGNFLVTAHRTSSTRAFADTPALRRGDRVRVDVGATRYVYEITRTRWTSFRSPASLAAQRAAVPGRPGVRPTRAMITLSTCATAEDHAAGNYWSDAHGNPEHRIDKIGVLVATRTR